MRGFQGGRVWADNLGSCIIIEEYCSACKPKVEVTKRQKRLVSYIRKTPVHSAIWPEDNEVYTKLELNIIDARRGR
jgi:hypothetical protein